MASMTIATFRRRVRAGTSLDLSGAPAFSSQGPAEFALDWVLRHAQTPEQQELALGALRTKCDILWAQLDAIYFSYVQPGWPPPGAFRIEEQK